MRFYLIATLIIHTLAASAQDLYDQYYMASRCSALLNFPLLVLVLS